MSQSLASGKIEGVGALAAKFGVKIDPNDRVLPEILSSTEVTCFACKLDEQMKLDNFFAKFQHYWLAIDKHPIPRLDLVLILHQTAKHLKDYRRHRDAAEFMSKNIASWERPALYKLKSNSFEARDLALIIYSYGRLGIKPSEEFRKAWEEKAIKAMEKGECNAMDLSTMLFAYAKLGKRPSEDFLKAWESLAKKRIRTGEFEIHHLSDSLYALGILSAVFMPEDRTGITNRIAKHIFEHVDKNYDLRELDISNQRKIYQAARWFDFDVKGKMRIPMEDECKSRYEQNFFAVLDHALYHDYKIIDPTETKIYEQLNHRVDRVYEKDGQRFYVELDGPHHFVHDHDENGKSVLTLDGSSRFQAVLANELVPGVTVIRIPFEAADLILDKATNPEEQAQFVRNLFRSVATKAGQILVVGPHPKKEGRLSPLPFYGHEDHDKNDLVKPEYHLAS